MGVPVAESRCSPAYRRGTAGTQADDWKVDEARAVAELALDHLAHRVELLRGHGAVVGAALACEVLALAGRRPARAGQGRVRGARGGRGRCPRTPAGCDTPMRCPRRARGRRSLRRSARRTSVRRPPAAPPPPVGAQPTRAGPVRASARSPELRSSTTASSRSYRPWSASSPCGARSHGPLPRAHFSSSSAGDPRNSILTCAADFPGYAGRGDFGSPIAHRSSLRSCAIREPLRMRGRRPAVIHAWPLGVVAVSDHAGEAWKPLALGALST